MLGLGTIGQFAIGQADTATAEIITPDKWFIALSEPPRSQPGLSARQQAAFFMQPSPFVSFSWFEALAEPTRVLPRSPAALARDFAMQMMPSPFVASGWFSPLAEPVRSRPALKVGQQQALAYQDDAITLTPFAWFMGFSDPVRTRPALRPPQNPTFVIDTAVIPVSRLTPWFVPLAEPVRKRSGLDAARQQFLATPSRLLPTPNIIGRLDAIETKDVFTSGARLWNRVISGEVGAIEQSFTGAEVGAVVVEPSVGTSGLIEPIATPASGSSVPAITTASVSIRIL